MGRKLTATITSVISLLLVACGGVEVTIRGEEFGDLGKTYKTDGSGTAYIPVEGGEYTICVEGEQGCSVVSVPEGSVIPVKP